MEIPQIVIKAAHENGFDKIEYTGIKDNALIYSLTYDNNTTEPTGLPTVAVLKDDKVFIVGGMDALNLL